MATLIAMDVRHITTPHFDLYHLPLADKYFQINYTSTQESPLKVNCQCRDRFLNHADEIGPWESNFPKYQCPLVHIFPEIFLCAMHATSSFIELSCLMTRRSLSPSLLNLLMKCCSSNQDQTYPHSQLETCWTCIPNLALQNWPICSKTSSGKRNTFLKTLPICSCYFSPWGQNIVAMISCILGYSTSEYIDEIILVFISIYTPGKPPAVIYDYAQFIAGSMHDQFLGMNNERVFKYSSILYHMFLYYQLEKFPFTLQKLDTKGQPRSVIFWTPLIHQYKSPYSYFDFIDLFVHPVMEMFTRSPPPRISP